MPAETFHGFDVAELLAQARASLGEHVVVLSLRRSGARGFELRVSDSPAGASAGARTPATAMAPPLEVLGSRPGTPAVIALVGPTGSGKTTTIAKLANHPAVFGDRPVGLLCLDTYRIGAVEQSRIYAELSRLPLEVAHEPGDLAGVLRRLRRCDVVLVDTAGRGPRAAADASATRAMLAALRPAEVHLSLPAGLQPAVARRVVGAHRGFGVTHLLATKLDEAPEDRTAFRIAEEDGLPMRWITVGQEVPADLRPAAWAFDPAFALEHRRAVPAEAS